MTGNKSLSFVSLGYWFLRARSIQMAKYSQNPSTFHLRGWPPKNSPTSGQVANRVLSCLSGHSDRSRALWCYSGVSTVDELRSTENARCTVSIRYIYDRCSWCTNALIYGLMLRFIYGESQPPSLGNAKTKENGNEASCIKCPFIYKHISLFSRKHE